MSSSRKQAIAISVLIVMIACVGWFARDFNKDLKDSNALSNTVVETDKTLNYFADSRMTRENKFDLAKTEYKNIISNKGLSKKTHDKVALKLESLIENDRRENTVETLIKGIGFDDALCMINGNNVEVCVKNAQELTDKQADEIQSIIVNTTKVSPSNIYVKVKE